MATIKFHQLEDFTAPGPCPVGNKIEREGQRDREHYEEETDGKGRGFTTVDRLL